MRVMLDYIGVSPHRYQAIFVPSEEQGTIQVNLKILRGIVYSVFTSGTTKEPYLCRQDSTSVVV